MEPLGCLFSLSLMEMETVSCRGRMWEEEPRVCLMFVGFRSGSRRDQRRSPE